jgi:diguanylate cyclase (GGDEF)-like protein/PAS domain S-box-containing protein
LNLDNIAIISDKKQLIFSYELILKTYGNITTHFISKDEKLEDIDFSKYKIIIVDLNELFNIKEFLNLCKFYDFKRKIVVFISVFDNLYLQNIQDDLKGISFIIKKPFLTSKLTNYLEKEIYKIKQINLISDKADILIDIIDLHPSRIAVFDNQGNFYYANMNYLNSYNIDINSVKELDFDSLKACDLKFNYIKSKLFVLKTFTVQNQEEHNTWYESVFFYTNSKHIIHIASDISTIKQKEIKLELAASFFENTSEGIIIANPQGIIQSVNNAFTKITGYSKDEAIGKYPNILKSGIHDSIFYEGMWNNLKSCGYFKGEIWNKRKNGEIYPQLISISKATNEKYKEEYYLSIFSDISTLREADKKVYYYANYDSLTTLPNRVYFEKQLNYIIKDALKKNEKFALFFIDIDKFKEVNDTYGHNVGDIMLQIVAKKFMHNIRKDDIIARLGGDEFTLILKNIKDIKFIEKFANNLKNKIAEPMEIENKIFNVSLSIGIAVYPNHGTKEMDLLKNADIAMYEVKENGRNAHKIYDKNMSSKVVTKVCMQNEIKNGILKNEFIMYYQPIIDFKTLKTVGAEALVRWNHPKKGIIAPNDFLSYVTSGNLDDEFGDMVIELVMQDIKKINQLIPRNKLTFSINISNKQFHNPFFCTNIAKTAQKFGISSSQIELEILETQIMQDKDLAKEKIESLHQMGFKIALDDFGTEYSSLNYLKYFKVDKLKIDQSFIKNILEDEDDFNITISIIHIAKLFKLKVQAEGVESKKHFDKLREYKCDFSQGYYHSKPIKREDFINSIESK